MAKHKKTVPQFFEMCNKVVDAAPQVSALIDILNASSEFKVFVVSFFDFCRFWQPFGSHFFEF